MKNFIIIFLIVLIVMPTFFSYTLAQSDSCQACLFELGEICLPNPLTYCTIGGFFDNIINMFIIFATPILVIMILISALLFITGGANPAKRAKAKNIIIYSIIGYAVILFAKTIITIIQAFI